MKSRTGFHGAVSRRTLAAMVRRLRPFRARFVAISVMGILLAVFDMVPPRLVGNAINTMSTGAFSMSQIFKIAAIWACVVAIGQLIHGIQIKLAYQTGDEVLAKTREEIFDHLQRVSLSFFDKSHIGRILAAFGSDLDALRGMASWGANTLTSNSAFFVLSAVMILRTDTTMFFAVAWLAPAMTILNFTYGKRLSRAWQTIRKDQVRIGTEQAENIAGSRVVTAFNRQEENLIQFNELLDLNTASRVHESRQNGIFQPMLQWLRFTGQAVVLLFGGYRVVTGQMRAGDLVAVSLYWEWFMTPAVNFGAFFNELVIAASGAERVLSILEEPAPHADEDNAIVLDPRAMAPSGHVRFENVSFGYTANTRALKNVSFEIQPGSTVALVGGTGSGKSTLISLLARFFVPNEGNIYLDGNDLTKLSSTSFAEQVSVVLQKNFLFSGTVRENLKYDRDDLTDEQIFEATRILGCHDSILKLPSGYDSEVGEAGSALSLGERQLICFARALVRKPPVLLLDEATSALDPFADFRVRLALKHLARNRTTFIVTHRLRTAVEADLILMMENGRIVEIGTHQQLLLKQGSYAKLYGDAARSKRRSIEPADLKSSVEKIVAET